MRVNVGLAQIYPKLGDLNSNLETHLAYIDRAAAAHVNVLVFPEMSMTGYQVQDLAPDIAIRTQPDDPIFGPMLEASHKLDIMFGFIHEDSRSRIYIASAYLSGGECLHVHHKLYLPTYAQFDEKRFLGEGERVRAFDTRFGRVGMLICEDFWHMSPPYLLWMDGADLLFFHSAGPGRGLDQDRLGSARWVELLNQTYASLFTDFVVHCNRVGYEDGKNFWGGSFIVDPNGEFLTRGDCFEEALIVQEIDLKQIRHARKRMPLLRDERPRLLHQELTRILNHEGDLH